MTDTDLGATDTVPQDIQTNGVHKGKHAVSAPDPMVSILAAFQSIPTDYHADLFNDFRAAADAQDLRRLLDTISDWAATAELYAHPKLASELQEAIGGRKRVADWLPG